MSTKRSNKYVRVHHLRNLLRNTDADEHQRFADYICKKTRVLYYWDDTGFAPPYVEDLAESWIEEKGLLVRLLMETVDDNGELIVFNIVGPGDKLHRFRKVMHRLVPENISLSIFPYQQVAAHLVQYEEVRKELEQAFDTLDIEIIEQD